MLTRALMVQAMLSHARVARLTVAQLHAMLEAGILQEAEPIELIDGVLVYKDRSEPGGDPMTIGKGHNLVVKLLARLDSELIRHGCHMQTQGPLSLPPFDEPEPDGLIVRGDPRDYADRVPSAGDVTSVIEVAASSLEYDRSKKLGLYARSGLLQYVIVNLRENVVEVYEAPLSGEERYSYTRVCHAHEKIALLVPSGEHLEIDANRILP